MTMICFVPLALIDPYLDASSPPIQFFSMISVSCSNVSGKDASMKMPAGPIPSIAYRNGMYLYLRSVLKFCFHSVYKMNLTHASTLLGENSRYFSELYKSFQFRDEQTLKEYLDFVIHEPVEWLKSFPSKLLTKSSFSRPKAVIIKLLKMDEVKNVIGGDYAKTVYDTIWKTFKDHHEEILRMRNTVPVTNVVDQMVEANESIHDDSGSEEQNIVAEEIEPQNELGAREKVREKVREKATVCERCLALEKNLNLSIQINRTLLQEYRFIVPGLIESATLLVDSLVLPPLPSLPSSSSS